MMSVISEHLHLYPEQGHQYYHHDRPQDVPLILTILPLQLCKTVIVWNPVIFVIMNPMVKFFILFFDGEGEKPGFFSKFAKISYGIFVNAGNGRKFLSANFCIKC